MIQFQKILSRTAESLSKVDVMGEVMGAALNAVDPATAIRGKLALNHNELIVGSVHVSLLDESRVIPVAFGKAAELMMIPTLEILGKRAVRGVCVSKYPSRRYSLFRRVINVKGDHPIPGEGSLQAGRVIQKVLGGLTQADVVLVLISGGGSALVSLPADNITHSEIQKLTAALLSSGQSITEINIVRKHLDLFKGGGLLRMAQPARSVALILSDVIDDPLDVIASGPTVADPSTFQQAQESISRCGISPQEIPNIMQRIAAGCEGKIEETYKKSYPEIGHFGNYVIGNNATACQAAAKKAERLGYNAEVITTSLKGEARDVGEYLAGYARELDSTRKKGVYIFGGETTVTIRGNGVGGRNLEVALGAIRGMDGLRDSVLITLATDGDDGPSQAAGAVVTGRTASRAAQLGLDPAAYLSDNDSFNFFRRLGNVLVSGPTGTNVNDISFIFNL